MLFEQRGGFNDARQRLTQPVHPHHRPADVVEHIAEPDSRARIDHHIFCLGKPVADFDHRADDPHEAAELAAQTEDPADGGRIRECFDRPLLEHLHAFLEPLEHRLVAIDDEVEDRVRGVIGPFGEPLGHGFQPRAQIVMRAGRADPHRHQEIAAEENRGLPVADVLPLFDRRGARDDKQVLAVDLDLGDLVGIERILDRQRVEAELGADQLHLRVAGIAQSDPVELIALGQHVFASVDDERLFLRFSVGIAAGGNDRHGRGLAKSRDAGNAA